MEDIFKTESRLQYKLLEASKKYERKIIREILDYFGITLKIYSVPMNINGYETLLSGAIRAIEKYKDENIAKLNGANDLVRKYNLFPRDIFTDPEDTKLSILEYDYYVRPRTKTQYAKEEAEAKAGINGKIPMDAE